jgi:hypothetical protein
MPSKKKLVSDIKTFTFNRDEWLYLSEKQSVIIHTNSLISRYVTLVVCGRLGVDPKTNNIKLTQDGTGITVEPKGPEIVVPK